MGKRNGIRVKSTALSVLAILVVAGVSFGQPKVIHGADAVFRRNGITILWAILKGRDEGSSTVYMRVIRGASADGELGSYSVMARDVLTGDETVAQGVRELRDVNTVTESRSAFTDMAQRRFLFYVSPRAPDPRDPAIEIYYYAIPDTAPEFLSKDALEGYLSDTAGRVDAAR